MCYEFNYFKYILKHMLCRFNGYECDLSFFFFGCFFKTSINRFKYLSFVVWFTCTLAVYHYEHLICIQIGIVYKTNLYFSVDYSMWFDRISKKRKTHDGRKCLRWFCFLCLLLLLLLPLPFYCKMTVCTKHSFLSFMKNWIFIH